MKTKDIVVGQEYAIRSYGSPRRATVVAVKVPRTYWPGTWSRSTATDGIAIQYAEPSRWGGDPQKDVVVPAQVLGPWADFAPAIEAKKARQDYDNEVLTVLRAVSGTVTLAGLDAVVRYNPSTDRITATVTMTRDQARDILGIELPKPPPGLDLPKAAPPVEDDLDDLDDDLLED